MNLAALLAVWICVSLLLTPLIGRLIWSALHAPPETGPLQDVVLPFARTELESEATD